jgi:hypothetical protein
MYSDHSGFFVGLTAERWFEAFSKSSSRCQLPSGEAAQAGANSSPRSAISPHVYFKPVADGMKLAGAPFMSGLLKMRSLETVLFLYRELHP